LHTTVVQNTAQNSSNNFPCYPPDNHHSSDDAYCRGEVYGEDAAVLLNSVIYTLHCFRAG